MTTKVCRIFSNCSCSKIGFSRVVVGTVKEALAALEKQKFDLIFLDLKLPDGPADDVYDAVKEAATRMPDRYYYGLSRQRDAGPDFGERSDHRFEEAAQGRAIERDSSHSRTQGSSQARCLIRSRLTASRLASDHDRADLD